MLCDSRKIHRLTREFHVKFHLKNRCRTHRFAIRAISVFRVKFNVEFPRQVVNFPKKIYAFRPLTSDGPMVSFLFCHAEGRRSSHVVDVADFFLPLSLNCIDVSFLYVKDTLVHIECEAVFRPWIPISFTW